MSFIVVVPEPIEDKIRSWNLSFETEDRLYELLSDGLKDGHEEKCSHVPAPAPTFVYEFQFQDPSYLGITHSFVFWLTYGPLDDALYVMDCYHEEEEDWSS